jgi:hypothetical protein
MTMVDYSQAFVSYLFKLVGRLLHAFLRLRLAILQLPLTCANVGMQSLVSGNVAKDRYGKGSWRKGIRLVENREMVTWNFILWLDCWK